MSDLHTHASAVSTHTEIMGLSVLPKSLMPSSLYYFFPLGPTSIVLGILRHIYKTQEHSAPRTLRIRTLLPCLCPCAHRICFCCDGVIQALLFPSLTFVWFHGGFPFRTTTAPPLPLLLVPHPLLCPTESFLSPAFTSCLCVLCDAVS